MKKIIAILLAALMCCLALTACNGGSGTEEETTNSIEQQLEDSKDTLTVVMECAYAPYNWTQSTDENGAVPIKGSTDFAYGYDVMIAKLIAEKLNMKLEVVKSDWDSLVPAVQAGTADCAIAGQSTTAERLVSVDFTKPYYYATIVTLVKADSKYADAKGLSDLAGATCTSQLNTIWYDNCLPQIKDANILAAQDNAPAMLTALKSGSCDLVVTDQPTATAACAANKDLKMLDFKDNAEDNFKVSDEEINIGISIKKGNTELLDKINAVLDTLTEDDYVRMMEEAAAVQPLAKAAGDEEDTAPEVETKEGDTLGSTEAA